MKDHFSRLVLISKGVHCTVYIACYDIPHLIDIVS